MNPTDVHFELGWYEIGMLAFVLAVIYGIFSLKSLLGGRTKPHITRQAAPGDEGDGEDVDEDEGEDFDWSGTPADDGEEEPSDEMESRGDPEDRA
jgi:hypothetical protein